jgi:diguanylate cyclase (GGDEF)-like protein
VNSNAQWARFLSFLQTKGHCDRHHDFRIGGDEFATLLQDNDYENRERLLEQFDERCFEKRSHETDAWEQVNVARGIAVYDPKEDESVNDVVRRADKSMYENKWKSEHSR